MRSSPGTEHDAAKPEEGRAQRAEPGELSHAELLAELERARALLAEMEERFLRARADLDNYRKRSEREVERRVEEQADEQLRRWLEVVDSVERALALEGHGQLAEGLHAVEEQMQALLARQGVTRLGAVGERFDPQLHDAVAAIPGSEHPPGSITAIARPGYAVGDRILRPAQVAVARPRDDAG
jgi:molecular chaperone GrpE